MILRLAECGHSYLGGSRGKPRHFCDECRPVRDRGRRGPEARWTGRDGLFVYPCGHELSTTAASELPLKCQTCLDARSCLQCGGTLAGRSPVTKFCSIVCADIARGMRREVALPARVCVLSECDATFIPKLAHQRACCERHGKLQYNREARAAGRQKPQQWNDARRDAYHKRRALKMGSRDPLEPVLLADIAARDGGLCGLCRENVDLDLPWPHPQSKSLDHITPLSRGGPHVASNVQLAHLGCNTAKGNRESLGVG